MFKYLKNLEYREYKKKDFKIKIQELKDGINLFENYIVIK